jgi:hypothetical protein
MPYRLKRQRGIARRQQTHPFALTKAGYRRRLPGNPSGRASRRTKLPWVAVRVFHNVTADDLGVALVPWPVELGDEITVEGHFWPLKWSTWCGLLRGRESRRS